MVGASLQETKKDNMTSFKGALELAAAAAAHHTAKYSFLRGRSSAEVSS
jgi:hypothetical protein